MGLIQSSRSRYGPLFILSKKDGKLRVVQDFRELNAKTMNDRYSIKDVNECIGDIGRAGSSIFSMILILFVSHLNSNFLGRNY
jgi:hypothetical protein